MTTTTVHERQPDTAIWPFADSSTRFRDPRTAAASFATTYLGFASPLVGDFRQGDSRSGEVAIRDASNGPVSTVLVRQLGSDSSWWILGCVSHAMLIDAPAAGALVSSPLTVTGTSTAFEAVVNVDVRADGSLTPLTSGVVMGGSMGVMGPFRGTFTFNTPAAAGGALVFRTYSARDGSVVEASVIRVHYRH